MFRFEHPEYLYALLILPVLLVLFFLYRRRKKRDLKRFGDMDIINNLMPDVSKAKEALKFWLLFFGVALFIIIVARPQLGSQMETVKKQGVEVMICLDVSNSMMSDDINPTRLDRAKMILSRLIDGFENDKVGLVVFAGDAYVQLPITTDFVSAKMFLSSINTNMVPVQGTKIGKAIDLAMRSFSSNQQIEKTIILITDGEGHEDNAVGSAKAAVEAGVKINVIGIGSAKGGTIPVGRNDYMRDNQNNIIVTKLNEEMCKEIAIAGNGIYVQADNTNNALNAVQKEIGKMGKADIETTIYSSYNEMYLIPAWILLAILVLDVFILNRKSRIFRNFKLFS